MKNSEYWEKRIANSTWQTYNNLEEKNRALLEMYQDASRAISEELYDLAEKMQTATPTRSDMHKHNRLTNLQKNMEDIIRELGEKVESFGKDNMKEGFKETYSNVMAKLGITEFDMVPEKVMEEMLEKPWMGRNFSTSLWKNTQVLADNLNDILVNGITQGKTVTEMAIQLNNRMNEGFNVSHRLIRTETMHYLNESAFKGYEDAGCEEVQLWAAEDERTCDICGAKHGKTYKLKDRPILPLHTLCRCTYLPIVDDNKRVKAINKDSEEIKFNLSNMKEESKAKLIENIKKLTLEYNTNLKTVISDKSQLKPGVRGWVDIVGETMNLRTSNVITTYHEFAHTLTNSKWEKYEIKTLDAEFWKEVKKVRREYNKAINVRDLSWEDKQKIYISNYADESVDEFMCEAFTRAKLEGTIDFEKTEYSNMCSPYAKKVLEIINKHFKK